MKKTKKGLNALLADFIILLNEKGEEAEEVKQLLKSHAANKELMKYINKAIETYNFFKIRAAKKNNEQ